MAKKKDPKKGTGKKPKGSGRRLYTDENPKDTVKIKFATPADARATVAKVKKVNKIVGPGGPYVTAAKKIVYGDVAIDMVAGPSEIGILTDSTANPKFVAADLLSQAEHGTSLEKALLITTSKKQAQLVKEQVLKQSTQLKRRKIITDVINNRSNFSFNVY